MIKSPGLSNSFNGRAPFINMIISLNDENGISNPSGTSLNRRKVSVKYLPKACLIIIDGFKEDNFGSFMSKERLDIFSKFLRDTPIVSEMAMSLEEDIKLGSETISKRLTLADRFSSVVDSDTLSNLDLDLLNT